MPTGTAWNVCTRAVSIHKAWWELLKLLDEEAMDMPQAMQFLSSHPLTQDVSPPPKLR